MVINFRFTNCFCLLAFKFANLCQYEIHILHSIRFVGLWDKTRVVTTYALVWFSGHDSLLNAETLGNRTTYTVFVFSIARVSRVQNNYCTNYELLTVLHNHSNKKDGYRQQNVRQRQKLISIIDYDVYMTFY